MSYDSLRLWFYVYLFCFGMYFETEGICPKVSSLVICAASTRLSHVEWGPVPPDVRGLEMEYFDWETPEKVSEDSSCFHLWIYMNNTYNIYIYILAPAPAL